MDAIDRQAAIDALGEGAMVNYQAAGHNNGLIKAIDVIKGLPSVQPQRWIPCSERLPEEPFGCLVTVWDTNPITMDEFENILPYFVGWDGDQWNDGEGEQCPFEVIAWMPLPEPWEEGEADGN